MVGVWLFGDVPPGQPSGPSYMLESWARELRRLGLAPRTFTPAAPGAARRRTATEVTFRSVRHVGYPGDHHARYSAVTELFRARRELPQVIVVATIGRVGVLGTILAAYFRLPLVMVVSTDTTAETAYYSATRAVVSGGVKPMLLMAVSRRARAAFFRRSARRAEPVSLLDRLIERTTAALTAQAGEVVLLSAKGLATYGAACADAHLTVLPSGIDRLPTAPVPAELVWPADVLRVLYVGRLAPEKNLAVLLQAVRIAADAGVQAHLVLVGEGPQRDWLRAEAGRLGIGDRLTVIGPYPRADLGGIYASAEVFAFPSVVDTQAFVLNEAAHEGLALLVSDTANGVVADGDSALVVPPDPVRYARALATLRDPRLRDRLGTAARERAGRLGEAAQCARLAEVIGTAQGHPSAGRAGAPAAPARARTGSVTEPRPVVADGSVSGVAPTR